MDKIVRIAGYSKKDDEHNPAIKEFVNAFRGYKSKSRIALFCSKKIRTVLKKLFIIVVHLYKHGNE